MSETIYVSAGVTSSGLVITNGEILDVLSGGMAVGIVVGRGGDEVVRSGATASGTIVSSGGGELAYGTDSGTTVSSGGIEYVGGTAIGTIVSSDGTEAVSSGGTASGAFVSSGGIEFVESGGTAGGTTVSSGGYLFALPGGTESATMVQMGGTVVSTGIVLVQSGVTVFPNTASGIVVSSGGSAYVLAGGTANSTTLNGGYEEVDSGGTAIATTVNDGTEAVVGGTTLGTIVSGGYEIVSSGGTASGITVESGGGLYVNNGGTAIGVVNNGGTVENFGGTITYACYRVGTLIRTDRGEVPIEALRAGDRVVSALGGTAAVTWLGHRRVNCRHHPKPHDVWPVRVAAGAFGTNQPRRDLWLSPDHAAFVDGVLIPIHYLVNDATIVQEPVDDMTYWHVELPAHDVLFAEGLPAESYLDTGNRGAFANGGGTAMLHPDFSLRKWEAEACAKLVREGADLVAVKARLIARLPALGFAITVEPDLRCLADGVAIMPQRFGAWWCLALPNGTRRLTLHSRRARPAELDPASDDTRLLGVAVRALRLDGNDLPLDDGRFVAGWYAAEHDLRWTDGGGVLSVEGASIVELLLRPLRRYHATRDTVARAA
jgi:autotransporter passenger strand-loop-strand repeat protein